MNTTPVLNTYQLTKRYGDRAAVDAVDLTVQQGEVYGFLGPNGAGKTTTLRMALGLIRPTSGTVSVLGRPAGSPDVVARVGALIEGPGFYPTLSGRDNLRVMAHYRGLPSSAIDDALRRVDLITRGRDSFRSYSLGMKQRLGVASALMGDPELIILDEPTNGLDPAGMTDMRSLIKDLAKDGHTVILSSHLMAEVEEICDRVGVIAAGKLVREAGVAELTGDTHLRITAEPLEEAVAVARRFVGPERVSVVDGDLLIDVPGPDHARSTHDLTAALIRELVLADVAVHTASPHSRRLEDVFFEVTAAA